MNTEEPQMTLNLITWNSGKSNNGNCTCISDHSGTSCTQTFNELKCMTVSVYVQPHLEDMYSRFPDYSLWCCVGLYYLKIVSNMFASQPTNYVDMRFKICHLL